MSKFTVEDFHCAECNYEGCCQAETANENTDADGNRGILVTYYTCPNCQEEYSYIK